MRQRADMTDIRVRNKHRIQMGGDVLQSVNDARGKVIRPATIQQYARIVN